MWMQWQELGFLQPAKLSRCGVCQGLAFRHIGKSMANRQIIIVYRFLYVFIRFYVMRLKQSVQISTGPGPWPSCFVAKLKTECHKLKQHWHYSSSFWPLETEPAVNVTQHWRWFLKNLGSEATAKISQKSTKRMDNMIPATKHPNQKGPSAWKV